MKALKTKGRGWDVFHADGSSDNTDGVTDYYEIQRIDCPEDDSDPAFDSDEEAVRYVVRLAKRGDKQAINALWKAYLDPLVHQVLWEDVL